LLSVLYSVNLIVTGVPDHSMQTPVQSPSNLLPGGPTKLLR
jgi:hypothetical protein